MSTAIITVSGLSVELGGTPVLRDVGLTADPGEIVAVVSANGAGNRYDRPAGLPAPGGSRTAVKM